MQVSMNCYHENRSSNITIDEGEDEMLTWDQLSENFFEFLVSCGFVLTREQFAAYWAQYLPPAETDEPGCCGGCGGCKK